MQESNVCTCVSSLRVFIVCMYAYSLYMCVSGLCVCMCV